MVRAAASAAPIRIVPKAERIAFGVGLTGDMAPGLATHAGGAGQIAPMEKATTPGAGAACPVADGDNNIQASRAALMRGRRTLSHAPVEMKHRVAEGNRR